MYEKTPHKLKKYVRGVLDFDGICCVCRERINKATSDVCHGCEGGHDIHSYSQAVSLLHPRNRDRIKLRTHVHIGEGEVDSEGRYERF